MGADPYVSRRTRVEPFAEAGRRTVNLGGRHELVDLHRRPRHAPQDRRGGSCVRAADRRDRHLGARAQPRHRHPHRAGPERDPGRRAGGDDRPRRAHDPLNPFFRLNFLPLARRICGAFFLSEAPNRSFCYLRDMVRRRLTPLLLSALLFAAAASALAQSAPDEAAMAAYRAKLAQWERVHGAYARIADAYWDEV